MNVSKKNPVQSTDRIFSILETMAISGPIGIGELSKSVELHKSTVHRLLISLICMNYAIQRPDGKYELTNKVVKLAKASVAHYGVNNATYCFLDKRNFIIHNRMLEYKRKMDRG